MPGGPSCAARPSRHAWLRAHEKRRAEGEIRLSGKQLRTLQKKIGARRVQDVASHLRRDGAACDIRARWRRPVRHQHAPRNSEAQPSDGGVLTRRCVEATVGSLREAHGNRHGEVALCEGKGWFGHPSARGDRGRAEKGRGGGGRGSAVTFWCKRGSAATAESGERPKKPNSESRKCLTFEYSGNVPPPLLLLSAGVFPTAPPPGYIHRRRKNR